MIHEVLVKQGTSKVWRKTGGDYAITLASLAEGAGRCGAKGDLGEKFAPRYAVTLEVAMDLAPAAGKTVELYWAASHDNTTFPGGATGNDEAYKAGEEDEWKKQLLPIGCLVVTSDAETVVQTQVFVFSPPTRYGCPVVVNKAGQAFDESDASHKITLTPLIDEIQ